jgi:hypothetical protein
MEYWDKSITTYSHARPLYYMSYRGLENLYHQNTKYQKPFVMISQKLGKRPVLSFPRRRESSLS